MANTYPTSTNNYSTGAASPTLASAGHADEHNQLEAKLGIGASTPTANNVLRSSGIGVSVWDKVGLTTDVTGILPIANGGTGASTAILARLNLGTPRIVNYIVGASADCDYITDGTDDDVQINAAITAAGIAGGGTILIKAGTYVLGNAISFEAVNNLRIIGEGMGNTILQAKAAFPTNHGVIENTSSGANIEIDHLTIDCNKANQTTENISCMDINGGSNHVFHHLELKNANSGTSYGNGIYTSVDYTQINNCYIHDNEVRGCYMDANYTTITNSHIVNNLGVGFGRGIHLQNRYNTVIGCYIEGNNTGVYSNWYGNSIIGCHFTLNLLYGIYENGNTLVIMSDNYFEANKQIAIQLNGSLYCQITGNTIRSETLDADNTYTGIKLVSASKNIVSNNVINANSFNSYKYGIEETSGGDQNIIVSNIVQLAETANIFTTGANTDVSHNITV